MPDDPLGQYQVTATQGTGQATGSFTLAAATQPHIVVSPPSGPVGTLFEVVLTGFQPDAEVQLYLYSAQAADLGWDYLSPLPPAQVDSRGSTRYQLTTLADDPAGRYRLLTQPPVDPNKAAGLDMFSIDAAQQAQPGSEQITPTPSPAATPFPEGPPTGDQGFTPELITWSPDGQLLALASEYQVFVRDTQGFALVHTLKVGEPRQEARTTLAIAFAPDSRTLAVATYDNLVQLWSLPKGTLAQTLATTGGLAWSPDGATLAVGSGSLQEDVANSVQLWRVADGSLSRTLPRDVHHYSATVAFSPDGSVLAVGSHNDLFGTAELWRIADGQLLHNLGTIDGYVNSLAFAPDGASLFMGLGGAEVQRIAVADGARLPGVPAIGMIALAPDGQTLAVAVDDGSVQLWNSEAPTLRTTIAAADIPLRSLAFSPDGRLLATAAHTVELWNPDDGQPVRSVAVP